MFNPRPSSGISHSFSKSSSKLDTINRSDSQNSSNLDHTSGQNSQDNTFITNKFRGDYVNLVKRNDEVFRDTKSKNTKNVLDFDTTYSADSNIDSLFGNNSALELSSDGVFEKNYLLRLMFTFERMSKMGNRKFISEPLHFHSVDVTTTYNKDQEQYYDKNDKMKKLLYKQNPTKRTFFENQPRLIKGVRNLGLKGVYREEDIGNESTEGDKAFEVFDMRKINESVKFKEVFNNTYNKEQNREYRQGINTDFVRQFTRDTNNTNDLNRQYINKDDTELSRSFSNNREQNLNELNKFTRDSSSTGELNRLFNRDTSNTTNELSRTFGNNREEVANDLSRHFSSETSGSDLTRHLNIESSPSNLNKHMSRDQITNELNRHMSREAFRESFKNVQQSWDREEQYQQKQGYLNTNNMVLTSSFTNSYKDYANSLSQSKDLLKDSFVESGSFYKDDNNRKLKEDTDQSFLERLLDKQLDNNDNVDTTEVNLNFNQNYIDGTRKIWNEVNLKWQYMDPQGMVHGPFSSEQMYHWYLKNFFPQNLRMRYNTKMAWVPFKDLFPTNSVPFKSLPKQFGSTGPTSTPGINSVNLGGATAMPTAVKDGWTQGTTNNLLSSPNSSFSNSTNNGSSSSTNLLAPSNLLNSNTSLLGPPTTTASLLGGSTASNTSLLAPSNLLATNSLLNPTSNATSLLGSDSGSPGLLGHSSNTTSLLGQATTTTGTASLLGPSTTTTTGLLGSATTTTQSLLGTSSNSSSAGLLNNRLDNRLENLWNNSQSTVHPISSMSNIHMGVSNMSISSVHQTSHNHLNKQMPGTSSNHMSQTQGLNKQMSGSSSHLTKQLQQSTNNHLPHTQVLNKFTRDTVTSATTTTTTTIPKDYSSSLNQTKQYSTSPSTLPPTKPVQPVPTTSVTAPPPRPAPPTNERKWNTPQVEVSSLFEIMELEKKSAKERVLKSPPPKPVQTGWNLSNVTSNNLSESDDFPSLSTVTTTTSNSNTTTSSTGKKFGKHITMPLETFIEKHPLTPPQLTESFSSKLLGNKH